MVSTAYAMAGSTQGAQGGNPYSGLIMLVLMFAIFYFLLIRPQQKRAKQHRELVDSLKGGDQIVTAGGIHGRVAAVEESVVTVEVATGVKIKVNRASIVSKKSE